MEKHFPRSHRLGRGGSPADVPMSAGIQPPDNLLGSFSGVTRASRSSATTELLPVGCALCIDLKRRRGRWWARLKSFGAEPEEQVVDRRVGVESGD